MIDLSPKSQNISLLVSENGKQVKRQAYTLSDIVLWRKLRNKIDSQILKPSPPYTSIDLIADLWSTFFGSLNELDFKIEQINEVNDDINERSDEDEDQNLLRKSLNPTPTIINFLKSYSNNILANLLTLTLKPDSDYNSNRNCREDDEIEHDNNDNEINDQLDNLNLSATDLLNLGLSPLSDVDSNVAQSLTKLELGRNVNVTLTYFWSIAKFIRRQFLSIGWI